jgi:trans-2-enoyl-CoA reductase
MTKNDILDRLGKFSDTAIRDVIKVLKNEMGYDDLIIQGLGGKELIKQPRVNNVIKADIEEAIDKAVPEYYGEEWDYIKR